GDGEPVDGAFAVLLSACDVGLEFAVVDGERDVLLHVGPGYGLNGLGVGAAGREGEQCRGAQNKQAKASQHRWNLQYRTAPVNRGGRGRIGSKAAMGKVWATVKVLGVGSWVLG